MVNIILTIIAVLIILEGFFITLSPLKSKKIFIKIFKNEKLTRKLGLIEIIIGAIILIVAMIT